MAERREPTLQALRDHDLLIRLDQKVDVLSTDIKEIKDGTAARLSKLEEDHVSRVEHTELAKKVRRLEDWRLYILGAAAAIGILVEAIFQYFVHH